MRKSASILLVALMLLISISSAASAEAGMPVGGCPVGFTLMPVMMHDMMEHTHVGITVDLNGDGYLCMKVAPSTTSTPIHVHVDNTVPLP
jgi:hypothetical protein